MGETLDYLEANAEELGGEAAGFPTSGHTVYTREEKKNLKGPKLAICLFCEFAFTADLRVRKCYLCGRPVTKFSRQYFYQENVELKSNGRMVKKNAKRNLRKKKTAR